MKIVVLGATGQTGRLVVEQALMRGDQVVGYVRNPHGIAASPGLEIAVGQLGDKIALKAAINGADAVLVCLGTHGKRMKTSVDLMQKSVPSIIDAMKEANVPRLVLVSAYGVGDTARTAGLIARVSGGSKGKGKQRITIGRKAPTVGAGSDSSGSFDSSAHGKAVSASAQDDAKRSRDDGKIRARKRVRG